MRSSVQRHPRPIDTLAAGAFAALVLGLAGCAKPLFSPQDQRTQYDRFDAVRNQYEPQYIEDEFGRRRPNLRGRLLPKS
ncbi:MAG: hypothetical protein IBJ10_11440 [Phycisphaerales bacterium]|nr:hypothetical protein [Phycisphaerales bacterium]